MELNDIRKTAEAAYLISTGWSYGDYKDSFEPAENDRLITESEWVEGEQYEEYVIDSIRNYILMDLAGDLGDPAEAEYEVKPNTPVIGIQFKGEEVDTAYYCVHEMLTAMDDAIADGATYEDDIYERVTRINLLLERVLGFTP